MLPKAMSQATIERLITQRVNAALTADHTARNTVGGSRGNVGGNGGQGGAPPVRECLFTGYLKCNPTVFHVNEGAVKLCQWFEKIESVFSISECAERNKLKFVASTLQGWALTWCNSQVATLGLEVANGKSWTELKTLMKEEFCPAKEIQRMESELWNLRKKKIEAYILGLSENVKGETTSSKPATLNEAVRMTHTLMEQKLQAKNERVTEGNKSRWENSQSSNKNNQNNNQGNYRDNSRYHQYNNQRQGNARAVTTAQNERVDQEGPAPNCNRCGMCHFGLCPPKCNKYGWIRHKARDCRGKAGTTSANAQPVVHCYECGEIGHKQDQCPKRINQRGSGQSFVNTSFSRLIDINPIKLNTSYEVKLADGKIVSTNTVLRDRTLNLIDHLFEIDLMPIELGTFDVVIGMDWLVARDAVIARKYIERGRHLYLAQVTEKEPAEKRLEDVPVIRDFPEVFPDDLPGLPPTRQVEFKIELVPGVVPVAHAPYRLAPSKMKELADQL
ncbi:putative reverse transcriptase domain-containing protein [Tanacetum coccineum]